MPIGETKMIHKNENSFSSQFCTFLPANNLELQLLCTMSQTHRKSNNNARRQLRNLCYKDLILPRKGWGHCPSHNRFGNDCVKIRSHRFGQMLNRQTLSTSLALTTVQLIDSRILILMLTSPSIAGASEPRKVRDSTIPTHRSRSRSRLTFPTA